MAKFNTDWPGLIKEGGWTEKPSGGYWPILERDVRNVRQTIILLESEWTLFVDSVFSNSGTLSEMLEYANSTLS